MHDPENQDHSDADYIDSHDNWTTSRLGGIAAGLMIAAEVLPVNVGCGIAMEYLVHNPDATAAFFGGSTALTKIMGSIGSVDYLSARSESRFKTLFHKITSKVQLDSQKTNWLVDLGIAMTAGTSAMSAVKLVQDPELTPSYNKKYGAALSLGVSAVFSVQSWLIAEDIQSPSPLIGGVSLLGIGTIFGVGKWLRRNRKG